MKNKKKKAVPATGRYRPVTERLIPREYSDRSSYYPSNGLTPRKLARIFKAADLGDVSEQMELFEEMEEKEPHLFSQLQTRKLAVSGLDWEIQPFSDDEKDKEVAEFITEQLKGIESLDEVFTDLLDAIGKGISVMELIWGTDRQGMNILEGIEYIHPKKLVWDSLTDEMKICTTAFPSGMSLINNKFVVHKYKAKSGFSSRNGILRVVAWMYLFKNYGVKDWIAFCEVFGMPLRLGKYGQTASEDDKKALMEAIYSLGSDAAGIVPDSTVIEFIESNKTSSAEIYEKLARYCDEQISKAVLGQTLSSDSGGGSYAQGKVHNEVRHDLTVADSKALAATIRRDIIRPLVEFNFGTDVDIPFFVFDCEESEDQKETVDIYKTLACDMGLKIPSSHIYKKFGIPKPEEGESVLEPGRRMEQIQEPAESFSLKETDPGIVQTDGITAEAVKASEKYFDEMLKPILKIIDTEDSLETLKEKLSDEKELEKLYKDMDSPELSDILHQAVYLSELIGRSRND